MITVVPAIIPESFSDLKEKIERVKDFVSLIQIDVFDGTLSPSINWPYNNLVDPDFQHLQRGETKLPYKDTVAYEIDVTVINPERFMDDWIIAGANSLIVHIEGTKKMHDIIDKCRKHRVHIGVALSPRTPNDAIAPYASDIDFIQCMGNDKVGYHGVALDDIVLGKIQDLRKRHPESIISVDIGVSRETAPLLIAAGANKLVSGSAVFDSPDIQKAIDELSRA